MVGLCGNYSYRLPLLFTFIVQGTEVITVIVENTFVTVVIIYNLILLAKKDRPLSYAE